MDYSFWTFCRGEREWDRAQAKGKSLYEAVFGVRGGFVVDDAVYSQVRET